MVVTSFHMPLLFKMQFGLRNCSSKQLASSIFNLGQNIGTYLIYYSSTINLKLVIEENMTKQSKT